MNLNFNPEMSTEEAFLSNTFLFDVRHDDCWSIDAMTNLDLRKSIVADILMVTMWEKEFNKKIFFGFSTLFRFLQMQQCVRVMKQFMDTECFGLFQLTDTCSGQNIRIKDNHEILQAAMDYCGTWYHGFEIHSDGPVICCAEVQERVEALGGLEAVVEKISTDVQSAVMDEKATVLVTSTILQ